MSQLLKLFDLVPGAVYALMLAVLMLTTQHFHAGMLTARADLATAQAEQAQATAAAQAQARQAEQDAQTQAAEITQDDHTRQKTRLATGADADHALAGLRSAIAAANARAATQTASAAAHAESAATARDILGACAARYRDVAAIADAMSDQITGLLDFDAVVRGEWGGYARR